LNSVATVSIKFSRPGVSIGQYSALTATIELTAVT
jgi:hypothetical protein